MIATHNAQTQNAAALKQATEAERAAQKSAETADLNKNKREAVVAANNKFIEEAEKQLAEKRKALADIPIADINRLDERSNLNREIDAQQRAVDQAREANKKLDTPEAKRRYDEAAATADKNLADAKAEVERLKKQQTELQTKYADLEQKNRILSNAENEAAATNARTKEAEDKTRQIGRAKSDINVIESFNASRADSAESLAKAAAALKDLQQIPDGIAKLAAAISGLDFGRVKQEVDDAHDRITRLESQFRNRP